MRFLARLLLNGIAILVAAYLLPGLHIDGPFAALLAGVILGFVNAIVRPVLFVLTLPLTLVTLGLFIFILNAICFALTAWRMRSFPANGCAVTAATLNDTRPTARYCPRSHWKAPISGPDAWPLMTL